MKSVANRKIIIIWWQKQIKGYRFKYFYEFPIHCILNLNNLYFVKPVTYGEFNKLHGLLTKTMAEVIGSCRAYDFAMASLTILLAKIITSAIITRAWNATPYVVVSAAIETFHLDQIWNYNFYYNFFSLSI